MKKKRKREDVALEIACRMGAMYQPSNYGKSVLESARFYKQMTGEDLGIKDLEKFVEEKEGKKTIWQRIKDLLF